MRRRLRGGRAPHSRRRRERGVAAWAMQGVYRAFDDGSVEFLASPVPPCPGEDSYVWIRYPNP